MRTLPSEWLGIVAFAVAATAACAALSFVLERLYKTQTAQLWKTGFGLLFITALGLGVGAVASSILSVGISMVASLFAPKALAGPIFLVAFTSSCFLICPIMVQTCFATSKPPITPSSVRDEDFPDT